MVTRAVQYLLSCLFLLNVEILLATIILCPYMQQYRPHYFFLFCLILLLFISWPKLGTHENENNKKKKMIQFNISISGPHAWSIFNIYKFYPLCRKVAKTYILIRLMLLWSNIGRSVEINIFREKVKNYQQYVLCRNLLVK